MANYLTTDTDLTSVANAIRTKGGTSANLTYPSGFVTAINAIPTGGGSQEVAATVYAANSGNKIAIQLTNGSSQSDSWNDNDETGKGAIGTYMVEHIGGTLYGMIADASGYVIWKGQMSHIGYSEDMGTSFNEYQFGGNITLTYLATRNDEYDPETGDLIGSITYFNAYANSNITTATYIYLSTTAF